MRPLASHSDTKACANVSVLGSTGSIGVNTLEVIRRHPDRFQVFGLSANRRMASLAEQCAQYQPQVAVVPDQTAADELHRLIGNRCPNLEVWTGATALEELASDERSDIVMAAIVGAAGLGACMAAARAGKRLCLANKEALVVGGDLFMTAVQRHGAQLLPIDSEHSAIFQCLPLDRGRWASTIDHIVLTASGGPFRERLHHSLDSVTPAQAVAHPNWVMGPKISVDSATMMNKALEVIEARWLFDLCADQIRVVIHPQSIIHSMVVCQDASVLAQLGTPDMKVPIAYGLSFPERIASGAPALDFLSLKALTFEPASADRFPGLQLAYDALKGPSGSCAVLNAANEVAVEAFLHERIRFTDIHRVNAYTLERGVPSGGAARDLADLIHIDTMARQWAREWVQRMPTGASS